MSLYYENQTALGKRLGISRVEVGRWLRDLGLRDANGKPTPDGLKYSKEMPVDPNDSTGRTFHVWCVYQVLPLLIEHQKTLNAIQGGAS